MSATAKVVCGSVLSAALIVDSAHQVKQLYYESGDCTGTPTETDGISGEHGCFTTSQGFQSENIICDPDNAAMHVTLYKDGQCSDSQVLNAFSIKSSSCHVEPTLGGSFSWACYNAASSKSATPFIFAKNAVNNAVVAAGMHQVKQLYYASGDCTGTPTETDGISGERGCFTTSQGFQSENIICDPDNAAMHVTLYKDGQCTDSQVLNAFSIASNSCHVEPTLGGSFSWACYNAASSKPATPLIVAKNAVSAAVVAESTHQVKQLYYASGDCTGTPTETDGISGEKGCFTTSQGFQSENIICDPNNAAMHVTLYKDSQCSDSQVLNAFSIASNSCHREPTLGGSFSWACYSPPSSKSATPFIFAKNAVNNAVVADGTHQVKQLYYASGDCTGTPTETDGISGDNGCFTTSQGFQSENIICDPDNAAMHVTLYKDGQCSDYLNAFSIASNSCHREPTLGGSFSWACHNAASAKSSVFV